MRVLFCAVMAAAPAVWAGEAGPLKKAEGQAREMIQERDREGSLRYRQLERLRKDLRYVSEVLDREVLGPRRKLEDYSQGGLARLKEVEKTGNVDPKLNPALERLAELYRGLPERTYAQEYPRSLVRAVSHELRWIAEEAKDEAELLKLLETQLVLPKGDSFEDVPQAQALFPVNVALNKFKRLGPIRIFIVKHRIRRPKHYGLEYAPTTADKIAGGGHNVQIGAEISGEVNYVDYAIDQDYTFNIGDLHIEITPEWRLAHPKLHLPKLGERVKVRGWTYFDIFHKAEEEYNPEDPVMGVNRFTQWEIHPVNDIELLP